MVVARRSAYTAWNASSGKTVNSAQIERPLMAIPAADRQRQGRSGPTGHGPAQRRIIWSRQRFAKASVRPEKH